MKVDKEKYELRWRKLTPCSSLSRDDIYVSRNTRPAGLVKRCRRLLHSGMSEVRLHATGSAINRAIAVALRLKKEAFGSLDVHVSTSSVTHTADLVPRLDSVDYGQITVPISAIQITIFKAKMPVSDY